MAEHRIHGLILTVNAILMQTSCPVFKICTTYTESEQNYTNVMIRSHVQYLKTKKPFSIHFLLIFCFKFFFFSPFEMN